MKKLKRQEVRYIREHLGHAGKGEIAKVLGVSDEELEAAITYLAIKPAKDPLPRTEGEPLPAVESGTRYWSRSVLVPIWIGVIVLAGGYAIYSFVDPSEKPIQVGKTDLEEEELDPIEDLIPETPAKTATKPKTSPKWAKKIKNLDDEKAIEKLIDEISKEPSLEGMQALMQLYVKTKKWDALLDYFQHQGLVREADKDPIILAGLGEALLAKEDYKEALRHYMTAARTVPNDAEYAKKVGIIYDRMNHPDRALRWLDTSLKLRWNQPDAVKVIKAIAARYPQHKKLANSVAATYYTNRSKEEHALLGGDPTRDPLAGILPEFPKVPDPNALIPKVNGNDKGPNIPAPIRNMPGMPKLPGTEGYKPVSPTPKAPN